MMGQFLGRRAVMAWALALPTVFPGSGARAQQRRGAAEGPPPAAAVAAPIRDLNTALLAAMRAGKATPFEQRFALLAPAVQRAFDLDALLRGAVGLRWAEMVAADQEALRAAFRRFSVASWVANFDSFSGQSFSVAEAVRDLGNGALAVETKLLGADGGSVELTYVMRETAGTWQAVDILAEGGISRVAVLRSDFRATLNAGGAQALVARLQDKAKALSGAS